MHARRLALIALMCAAAACSAPTPEAPPTPPPPAAPLVPAVALYVTNEQSGDLSVIDAATNEIVRTIPVGKRPRGASVSPDGKTPLRRAQRLAHRRPRRGREQAAAARSYG